MPLVLPNQGEGILLKNTLKGGLEGDPAWNVGLYINNYTPVQTSVNADFTEATFPGYAQEAIDPSLWTSPTIISNRASMTANSGDPYEFTNSGSSQTIYGYFIYDTTSSLIIGAEKFATSRTINTGDTLEVTVNWTGGTQT
jgi:hypothetical protein